MNFRFPKRIALWLSRYLQVVPIEETFLSRVKIAKKVTLSPAVVRLNYLDRSPFSQGGVLYVRQKEDLYLWFLRSDNSSAWVNIPEAYLLYRAYTADLKEGIIVFPKQNCTAYLIIKSEKLTAQVVVSKERWSEEYEAELLQLLTREHSLTQPTILRHSPGTELPLDWRVIQACLHWDFNPSQLLKRGFELFQGPLIVYLVILSAYQLFTLQRLEDRHEQLQTEQVEIKNRNRPLKQHYKELQSEVTFWKEFSNMEIHRPNLQQLLGVVADATAADSGTILMFRYSGNNVSARIETRSGAAGLVQRLLDSGYFQQVKVISSRQARENKDLQEIDLALQLKTDAPAPAKEESS